MAEMEQRRTDARPAEPSAPVDDARRMRRERLKRYRRHRRRVLVFILILSLALGYGAFSFVIELVRVDGAGMSPTLEAGSTVVCIKQGLLDKLAGIVPENLRRVGKNDLVLIDYRSEAGGEARSALLVKRVIAMDGDTLDTGGGELIVNREDAVGTLGDSDLVYPVTVPAGTVFVIGDNRSLSVDSRQRSFGMVAAADVVARPVAVIWPVYAAGLVK